MRVKELIEKLQSLNSPESIVVVSGNEGGVSDITKIKEIEIALNVNTEWYYGRHEDIKEMEYRKEEIKETATAIYLF